MEDDITAIRLLKKDDIGGLETLVSRYQVKAIRAAFLIVREEQLAEDVVQETFLRIFKHIRRFDETRPFEPYLLRSVVNAALDAARKTSKHEQTTVGIDSVEDLIQLAISVENQVAFRTLRLEIYQALEKLSPRQRAAIVMRYFLGMNEKEMANMLGMPFKIGITPLKVPGLTANAFKATYIKEGNMRGFEIGIEADPALLGLTYSISSRLDTSGMQQVGSSSGSFRDEKTGLLISRITTDAPLRFPLYLAARMAQIGGNWTVSWNPPPANAGATPFYPEQACLTLDTWKQAVANPQAIPPNLPKSVLVKRGAVSPYPSLFISSLDGKLDTPLVFGHGSLSPDGSQLVYTDENDNLLILDIASKQKRLVLTGDNLSPYWSPDGTKIALARQTDKGFNIFVMTSDGQNLRALTEVTTNPELAGWMPDGKHLIYAVGDDTGFYRFIMLDTETSDVALLVSTQQGYASGIGISPDGQSMAYMAHVPGRVAPGLYFSRLDGSEQRLLVQLDYWGITSPVISPDGHWLAVSVMNADLPDTPMTPAVINVETCQVVPLPAIQGEIHGWVK